MRTNLPAAALATPAGARANDILRSCVHCGFCNATCPTYQLLGDELDGPRGRIYLIKEMLEAGVANATAQTHLDRCLTCRACETTCPSGVRYGELLEIGRDIVEDAVPRTWFERLQRRWLKAVVPFPARLRAWLRLGVVFRRFAPEPLRALIATPPPAPPHAASSEASSVLLLGGCVQSVMTPQVNRHLASLLSARGVGAQMAEGEGCCGALALHLGDAEAARVAMRGNLERLPWQGVERIVSTASGCGVTLKSYAQTLAEDEQSVSAARDFVSKVCDVVELLEGFEFKRHTEFRRVAWHAPCTLQHGQRLAGQVEALLARAGYELVPVRDGHLCCGAAGAYSVLQPDIATALQGRKIEALTEHGPDVVATANIGCQLHLRAATDIPVMHWVELLG